EKEGASTAGNEPPTPFYNVFAPPVRKGDVVRYKALGKTREGTVAHQGWHGELFAEPESHRAPVAVREAEGGLQAIPPDLYRVPSGCSGRVGPRADDARGEAGVADDPELPGVRRCLTPGRVKYSSSRNT